MPDAVIKNIDSIVKRIKDLREFCDFQIDEFASSLGLNTPEYLDYENGIRDLPIGILYNIAAKLNIDPTVLLTGKMSDQCETQVVYDEKGTEVVRFPGYKFTTLASNYLGRNMEPMIVEIRNDIKPEMVTHNGQEFNYVLDGSIRVIVGHKEYCLRVGDSIYFNPLIPHAQIAITETAKFLTVITEKE